MNETKIRIALTKASTFINRVGKILDDERELSRIKRGYGSMKSGALRRASMELTRALAEMRKAG